MSDYLYNILARSLGLIETAQPLVTSLFEPPRDFKPVDALQPSEPAEEPAPASAPGVASAQPVASIDNRQDAPVEPTQTPVLNSSSVVNVPAAFSQAQPLPAPLTGESRPRVNSAEQAREKASEQPGVRLNQAPPAAQTIRTPERSQLELSDSVLKNPAHAPQKKESPAKAQTITGERARERREPAAQRPPPPEPFAKQRAVEQALSQERLPGPSVEINNVTHQRSETVIVQPQVSRYVELQPPDSTQPPRANEATEQTVQVTIGRIEVRATPPATARPGAHKRSAPQPSQSLEEYLRQRARGNGSR